MKNLFEVNVKMNKYSLILFTLVYELHLKEKKKFLRFFLYFYTFTIILLIWKTLINFFMILNRNYSKWKEKILSHCKPFIYISLLKGIIFIYFTIAIVQQSGFWTTKSFEISFVKSKHVVNKFISRKYMCFLYLKFRFPWPFLYRLT